MTNFGRITFVLAALGLDLVTAAGASAAAICNIGPGLAGVGPAENYAAIPAAGKVILSALMLMGLGDDGSKAYIENRAPGQATGKTGRKLPEEFRAGLDVYFDALEGKRIE